MSVCVSVCLFVCTIGCSFFQGLSLALRSHDQFQASHWSTPLLLFTESAPLGRFSHRVTMSVCLCVSVSVCLRHQMQFFLGLSLVLRSHDHFPGLSFVLPPSLPPSETRKLGNPPPRFFFVLYFVGSFQDKKYKV